MKKEAMKPVADELRKYFKGSEFENYIFSVSGPIKASVLREDGKYRLHPLIGKEEFLFEDIYIGAKQQLIFQFRPMDKRPYKLVEFDETKITQAFPEFLLNASRGLGFDSAVKFSEAKTKFITTALNEMKNEEESFYEDNPLWGSF
jgi:hypothetical protein